jgi:hypothetical protein
MPHTYHKHGCRNRIYNSMRIIIIIIIIIGCVVAFGGRMNSHHTNNGGCVGGGCCCCSVGESVSATTSDTVVLVLLPNIYIYIYIYTMVCGVYIINVHTFILHDWFRIGYKRYRYRTQISRLSHRLGPGYSDMRFIITWKTTFLFCHTLWSRW